MYYLFPYLCSFLLVLFQSVDVFIHRTRINIYSPYKFSVVLHRMKETMCKKKKKQKTKLHIYATCLFSFDHNTIMCNTRAIVQ